MPAQSPTVVVTDREYHKARAVFDNATGVRCVCAPSAEAGLVEVIRAEGARYAVVGSLAYTGPLYEALPRGGVIARFGVGHDGIDKPKATAAGLHATNTPGVLDQSVAEHAMLLMLAAARNFRTPREQEPGFELAGKALAVIGCGPIGRATARCAAFGFGMQVTGCDPVVHADPDFLRRWGFRAVVADFAAAVAGADFVSLHIPATPENARFLNRERLALLTPRTWVVNTARGIVVDENALYDALTSHQIAGAALDVFTIEPYTPLDPARDLSTLPNALLTPHIGSNTAESNRRMAERALANIALAIAGRTTEMDLLNRAVL